MTRDETTITPPPRGETNPPPLGGRAARGVAWLTGQTLAGKLVNTFGQIALAWLLVPDDFGVIGLAYTVTAWPSMMQQVGLQDVLAHRQHQFRRWANPAFWMGMALGCAAGLVVFALAPLGVFVYDEPRLAPVIQIMALSMPLRALGLVPQARLRNELRFRAQATIGIGATVTQTLTSIVLAWFGFGALSFAIPLPIAAAVSTAALWVVARPPVRWRPQWRRWRYLVGDSGFLLVGSLSAMAIAQGDYLILGIFLSSGAVGLYYFAFNLSMQTQRLLSRNLAAVLLPTLSKIQMDSDRQMKAFLRALRLLAAVAVPLCFLQAAASGPFIRLLFAPRWHAAGPIMAILSVGMAIRVVASPADNLIKSQGRFGTHAAQWFTLATSFLAMVLAGVLIAGLVGVTVAVAVHSTVIGLVILYGAAKPHPRHVPAVVAAVGLPTLGGAAASLLGVAAATAASAALPTGRTHDLVEFITILAVGGTTDLLFTKKALPGVYAELTKMTRRAAARWKTA